MSAMDKVNNILGKLPFVKLAGNIPEGIRGKIPVLNLLIPFANHIASGVAVVVLVACIGGGGGSNGTYESARGSRLVLSSGNKVAFQGASLSNGVATGEYRTASGTYTSSGNKITITYDSGFLSGQVHEWTLLDDSLTSSIDGSIFTKK